VSPRFLRVLRVSVSPPSTGGLLYLQYNETKKIPVLDGKKKREVNEREKKAPQTPSEMDHIYPRVSLRVVLALPVSSGILRVEFGGQVGG
jgi:hypothetical protein